MYVKEVKRPYGSYHYVVREYGVGGGKRKQDVVMSLGPHSSIEKARDAASRII